MKNLFLLLTAALLVFSCSKPTSYEKGDDPLNGWGKYPKYSQAGTPNDLIAGQHINVGTVTYEIDNTAGVFRVTYNTTGGWVITEAHMYAGPRYGWPHNKPGNPQVGHFPAAGYYNPSVTQAILELPLSSLPDPEEGFDVAAHCCVKNGNQNETAWAYCDPTTNGDYGSIPFTSKGWGWYDKFTFHLTPPPSYKILYGTQYIGDTLMLYHVNLDLGEATLIMKEYVGQTLDGTAYDMETGRFFFIVDSDELYTNALREDDLSSYHAGTLDNAALSGTYNDGSYYYIASTANTINIVTFNDAWQITGETPLDTIPDGVVIYDMAMSPVGDVMFMTGSVDNGPVEWIVWDMTTGVFSQTGTYVNPGMQIAYGPDGALYAVSPTFAGGTHSTTYIVNTSDFQLTEISDGGGIIIIDDPNNDDPFGGMSIGPWM